MDNGGLQLIPGTKRTVNIKRPGENKFLIIGFLIAAFLVVGAVTMNVYRASAEKNLVEKLDSLNQLEAKRDKEAEKRIKILSSQIRVIKDALLAHSYWTQGFSRIENATKNEVQFLGMNVNTTEGKMTIEAQAPNYTLVARQIAALVADESMTDIQLTKAASSTNNQIRFTLAIKFDPIKLIKKK